nr:DUF4244 domain-containing protein [Glycomyces sp. NRRL B-16210]
MHTNTDTTIALPNRREPGHLSRPAAVESDRRPASCRPESRWRTVGGQHRTRDAAVTKTATSGRTKAEANTDDIESTETAAANAATKTSETVKVPEATEATEAPEPAATASRWSPGSNRCRTPITAGPSPLTEDRTTTENPNPRSSAENEWSPGKMQGVRKPGWGARFTAKLRGESGMSTAEYAVGTLAAVAFAGVLLKVLTSGTVQGALSSLIERALS